MEAWWKKGGKQERDSVRNRAVAYYRHSAEIGQENSVEIQQDNIRTFAEKHGIEVIHEFSDRGKSGLNAEGRPAFNEMMEWVRTRDDFQYVLVLDVSRWGRFQNTDLSAHYKALCTQNRKLVVYTNNGFAKEDDLIHSLRESIDRYQAADYSRALSKKVFEGCVKVAKQGYRPGGPPPYGFHRMMLDERKQPDRILQPGQRKAIQNGRVILVPGNPDHTAVIQEIYMMFVEQKLDERQIAGVLNGRGVFSPGGRNWSDAAVRHILTNQQYVGAVVYNKTSRKLKTPVRKNPEACWVITPNAYDPIVTQEIFDKAQILLDARKRRYSREELLKRLHALYEKYAVITSRLVHFDAESASPATYAKHFGSLGAAFQQLSATTLQRAKDQVALEIGGLARLIDEHEDFMVINQTFTVLIQPSVPRYFGYELCWEFWPDPRPTVDLTIGVALSEDEDRSILGFLAMPRLLLPAQRGVRLFCNSDVRIEMQAHSGLDFLKELMA